MEIGKVKTKKQYLGVNYHPFRFRLVRNLTEIDLHLA
jgi:hypothetical protein